MTRHLQLHSVRAPLARHVAAAAHARDLFGPGDRILIAVSGGPDSVALLSVLVSLAPAWNLTLRVAHINHGLRGEEAEADARFVSALCERIGVTCRCERVDLSGPDGRQKGRSLQESAREARYATLRRLAETWGANKVALGHTADDQAETLVMWMLRGSGTAGLAGMPAARDSLFIRPLLDSSRADILAYLEAEGMAYRTDSSNAKPLYLRNRVRHQVLPALKRMNPGILGVLGRQAEILRAEDQCLDHLAAGHLARLAHAGPDGEMTLERAGLLALPLALQRRVVRTLLRHTGRTPRGPTFGAVSAVLERVIHGRSGAALTAHGTLVAREYGRIRLRPARPGPGSATRNAAGSEAVGLVLPLAVPGTLYWPPTGRLIRATMERMAPDGRRRCSAEPRDGAQFDAERLTMNLVVRSWQPGDAFQPLGMGGRTKKLQDVFSDLKMPRDQRRRVPLVVSPEGIVWVGGHRPDHRFRVTGSTRRMLSLELVDRAPERGD